MKKVTFNTAKALKKAGYPQNPYNDTLWFDLNGEQSSDEAVIDGDVDIDAVCAAPTYLEARLWLWRKKRWFIQIQPFKDKFCYQILDHHYDEWHSWGCIKHD